MIHSGACYEENFNYSGIIDFFDSFIISRKGKIFFVNLYYEDADVQLGEDDDPVFYMDALEPYSSTKMMVTTRTGTYKLYFKISSEKKWYFWALDGKNAEKCRIKNDDIACIILGNDGNIYLYYLTEPKGSGALISFINGTGESLPKMTVGKNWEEPIVYAEDLDSNTITNFISLKQGNYGLFWQSEDQKSEERYFFYPDEEGEIEMNNFKSGNYYLFMTYAEDDKNFAAWYEISP